jgi:hypothetical protein
VRRFLAVAVVALVSACASSTAAVTGPGDVAVQSKDVPTKVSRCDGSGDIDSFLNTIKTKDPTSYDQTKTEWDDAKSHGATSAQVVFFADTKDHCATVQNSKNSDISTATYPLVINFVVQFKDEATAQDGYTNQSIFGFSQSSLSSGGGAGVVKGKDTGLTPNSISLTVAIGSQSFYFAVWQNKAFMVILGLLNLGLDDSKKLASTVNGRIH